MIYTICKSCNAAFPALLDRCSHCGSRFVYEQEVDAANLERRGKTRFLKPSSECVGGINVAYIGED